MLVNGVNVVLSGSESNYSGAALAWVTKVEREYVVLSLPLNSEIAQVIEKGKSFSISALNQNQADVARQYGGAKQISQLPKNSADLDFETTSQPIVREASGWFICQVVETKVLNEQLLVIASILESKFDSKSEPLIYDHGAFFE